MHFKQVGFYFNSIFKRATEKSIFNFAFITNQLQSSHNITIRNNSKDAPHPQATPLHASFKNKFVLRTPLDIRLKQTQSC